MVVFSVTRKYDHFVFRSQIVIYKRLVFSVLYLFLKCPTVVLYENLEYDCICYHLCIAIVRGEAENNLPGFCEEF